MIAYIEKQVQKANFAKSQYSYSTSTLPLPLYVIEADDSIWFLPATGSFESYKLYQRVAMGDPLFPAISEYIESIKDSNRDGQYLFKPGKEPLELFDQQKIPRGIYPRDCFYDTDHFQFVIWDFVFSRQGELLIHKRSENAKDNQGMWDKSVGGHVDFRVERSSSDAAVRELVEELFTVEHAQQTGHDFSLLDVSKSNIRFLGDWQPGDIGGDYLNQISLFEEDTKLGAEPYCFYQIPGSSIAHNTPRTLPDGRVRKLRVLADIFIVIANTQLNHDYIDNGPLKNSRYRLVEPSRLKSWTETGVDDSGMEFKVTPDLEFILSGKLRDTIDEVNQLIQYSQIRK